MIFFCQTSFWLLFPKYWKQNISVHDRATELNFSIFHLGQNYLEKVKDFEKVTVLECWIAVGWANLMDNQWLLSWTCDRRDPIIILLRQYVRAKPSIMHGVIIETIYLYKDKTWSSSILKQVWIWAYCKTEMGFKWKLNNVVLGKSIYSFKLM